MVHAERPRHPRRTGGTSIRRGFFPRLTALLSASALLSACISGRAEEPASSLRVQIPVPGNSVVIEDDFWAPRLKVWVEFTIPDCFAKFERDGAMANFDKVRDGVGGKHGGPPWYDGLIYEMIRAGADFLACKPDPALEG